MRRPIPVLILLLASLTSACLTGGGSPRPAVVAPQPPPAGGGELVTFEIFVHDMTAPDRGLGGVAATCGGETRTTNGDGTAHFDVETGRQLDCRFTRDGYDPQTASAVPGLDARLSTWMHRTFTPAAALHPLHVEPNRRWFGTAAGRFDYREYSAFALQGMLQAGQDDAVRENLRGARAMGFTVARVFLAYRYNGPPAGPDQPIFYPALDRLLALAAAEGMYLRLTFIAASEPWGGVWHPDRRDIWSGSVRAGGEAFAVAVARHVCGQPHVLGELANEPGQIGMRDSFDELVSLGRQVKAACPSLLLGGGAVDGPNDQDPRLAVAPFDYVDAHIERRAEVGGFEWVKRSGEYALIDQEHLPTSWRGPFISGEPINFVEGKAGDTEPSPAVAFAYAAVSRARQFNTNYHFDGGLYGRLPEPRGAESVRCYHAALDAYPMTTDGKWRGHWGLAAGDYWRDVWPNSDGTREVEDHIRRGRGPWRAFGSGPYSVVFPQPAGWSWREHLDAPAERLAECSGGDFSAAVYRRQ
jgi:hypothetical protein